MQTLWYILVAAMLTAYVVLDGFDLGTGALYLIVARTDEERRMLLHSIGPVWDGNEVWLLAAGGTLFYAFPLLYAASFSGFYLPLNIVLWMLLFRAVGIEFRTHLNHIVWRDFFDAVFSLASLLLIVLFGAAFGNVLRGVPLGADHYFFISLWTNFQPGPEPGVLDWYTVLSAIVGVVALSTHGCLYLILKTEDPLNSRLRAMLRWLWPALAVVTILSLAATLFVRPGLLANYLSMPAGWIIPVVVIASLLGILLFTRNRRERDAFLASCLYLVSVLGGAAFGMYPSLLPASADPANDITIHNAAAGAQSLSIGLIWWTIGMAIAVAYFVFVYRMFQGKVRRQARDMHAS